MPSCPKSSADTVRGQSPPTAAAKNPFINSELANALRCGTPLALLWLGLIANAHGYDISPLFDVDCPRSSRAAGARQRSQTAVRARADPRYDAAGRALSARRLDRSPAAGAGIAPAAVVGKRIGHA